MADKARRETDKILSEMEKKITKIYEEAQDDLTDKWEAYMLREQDRLDKMREAFLNAPNREERRQAMQRWQDEIQRFTFRNQYYRDMIDEVSTRLANVNAIALTYTNGNLPHIYALNYNQKVDGLREAGISFDIVDENVLRNLITQGEVTLPYKNLNRIKDKEWNKRKMNSALMQGILQGESMDKIAARMLPIVNGNRDAAIRNARTLVTGTENKGRQDRYDDLAERGAIINKEWMATVDDRVRDWHAIMDGQEVRYNEMFIDGLGNRLEYPADPSAPAETVYNCRCSMRSHVIGVRMKDGEVRYFR